MADPSNNQKENQTTRDYFHDRFVLLMLTINTFLAVVCIVSIFLRLGDTSSSYIEAYRANLGINAYSVGGVEQIISFAIFALAVLVGQFFLSLKFHPIRKQASWLIMLLASLLLLLSIIVGNSLLGLR